MRAVSFDRYGDPGSVLSVRDVPTPEPGRGQVLVRLEASPINPSDLAFVEGNYGFRKPLPAVPGFEGAGTVVATNAGPYGRWLMGRRVACSAPQDGHGAWAEYMACGALSCVPLRRSVGTDFGASLLVNPVTAVSLVAMARRRSPGGFIQSAAGSSLGRMIARWAQHESIAAIHVVRSDAAADALRAMNEPHVLVSADPDFDARLRTLARELKIRIAFDAVGGQLSARLAAAMPQGGRVVVYGGLSGEDAQAPISELIFRGTSIEGFWLPLEVKRIGMLGLLRRVDIVQRMGAAMFGSPVLARLPYERIGEALALQPRGTDGKVLLTP
jgi:NADPH:quinone reductase-like Zn-dependent oxidoreductase